MHNIIIQGTGKVGTLNNLPAPISSDPLFEGYLIAVHNVFTNKKNVKLGSIVVWRCDSGIPLTQDENLLWCPVNGCLGLHLASHTLSEEDYRVIEELENDYEALQPGAHVDPSLWPLEIQNKVANHWDEEVQCPLCQHVCTRNFLCTTYHYQHNDNHMGGVIADIYRLLYSSASVMMINHKTQNAFKKTKEALSDKMFNRSRYEKILSAAREKEDIVIFRKKDIQKQLLTGTTADKVFASFLSS